jgi:hypothetical protein
MDDDAADVFLRDSAVVSAWLVRAQAASAGFQTIDVWFVLVCTYHMFQRALFSYLRLVS